MMTEPRFQVTPDWVRRHAATFDIPLGETEVADLAAQLAGGFAGIAELWRVDVDGVEPGVILPLERR